MPLTLASLSDLIDPPFDTIIDVRSPSEFAEDRIPGAINLPVLSDEERARVGTIYTQVSAFDGRKIGGALVARNTAGHLEDSLADRDGSWRPLVYCWRGGQRSGFFASFLREVGWRAETITGGYQGYRRLVHDLLYGPALTHRIVLLDGNTGTAKTDILNLLPGMGVQSIDLEGLARHRGSLLGSTGKAQPAQKAFESDLASAIASLDPERPVILEAESSKIGRINLPPALWAAMCRAPRIELSAPLAERATYTAGLYADQLADVEGFTELFQPLRRFRGHDVVDRWADLLAAGDQVGFVAAIMRDHYDPTYAKSRATRAPEVMARLEAARLDSDGQLKIAAEVARRVRKI